MKSIMIAFTSSFVVPMKTLFCHLPKKTYRLRFASSIQSQYNIPDIEIKKMRIKNVNVAYKLICDAFPLSHPYSWDRALGRSVTHLEQFVESLLQETIESDWGCFSAWRDRELVGTIILEEYFLTSDIYVGASDEESDFPPECLALIDKCYSIFYEEFHLRNRRNSKKYKLDSKCVVVGGIAVKEGMRGKGICSSLLNIGLNSIRMNGCDYAVAFCISPISTRAFEKEGFEAWGCISYKEFEYEGRYPFDILPDGTSVVVKEMN